MRFANIQSFEQQRGPAADLYCENFGQNFCGHLPFAFSPSSTSRRMASDRPGSSACLSAQRSTASESLAGSLTAVTGSTPPTFFGRPRRILFAEIDFAIL